MDAGDDRNSVFREPHLQPDTPGPADPSEARADRTLGREARRRPAADPVTDGVFDEPDILPGRLQEVIEQDWSCSACGYNLRGLHTGHRCPECGHVELYRPPPPDADSYRARLIRRMTGTPPAIGWWVAVVGMMVGGVCAVFGAFVESAGVGFVWGTLVLTAIVGPAIEETMKISTAALVIELRPWFFRRTEQIRLATIGAAALFAAIENMLYLTVYVSQPTMTLTIWRWTACTALHVGCTTVASRGLIAVWRRTVQELRPPRISDCIPTLTMAIVIHGVYNAAAVAYQIIGSPLG